MLGNLIICSDRKKYHLFTQKTGKFHPLSANTNIMTVRMMNGLVIDRKTSSQEKCGFYTKLKINAKYENSQFYRGTVV